HHVRGNTSRCKLLKGGWRSSLRRGEACLALFRHSRLSMAGDACVAPSASDSSSGQYGGGPYPWKSPALQPKATASFEWRSLVAALRGGVGSSWRRMDSL